MYVAMLLHESVAVTVGNKGQVVTHTNKGVCAQRVRELCKGWTRDFQYLSCKHHTLHHGSSRPVGQSLHLLSMFQACQLASLSCSSAKSH